MTDQDTLELHRMIAEDPLPVGPPDVDGFVTTGARRLRRRRIGVGAASVAALAAVSVPAYVVAAGDSPGPSGTDPAAPPPMASTNAAGLECGAMTCLDAETNPRPTKDPLVGDPWVLSSFSDDSEEVVYAVRTDGHDLATGDPAKVDVVTIGRRVDGELYGVVSALQPGSEAASPEGDPVLFWSNRTLVGDPDSEEYVVVGFVPGAPDEITWSTPDRDSGPVDGTSTTVVDGFTVFYLTPELPEGYESTGDEPRRDTRSGGHVILEGDAAGAAWPPDLTIHTSDGWSCSLADCGSLG